MRFGILHLLVVTTITCVYAAVIGAFMARGGFSGDFWQTLASPVSLLLLVSWFGQPFYRQYQDSRAARVTHQGRVSDFFFKKSSWRHAMITGFFLLLSLPLLSTPTPELPWYLVPLCVSMHIGVVVTQRIRFTDKAVLSPQGTVEWGKHRVSMKEDPPRLVCWREPNTERLAPTIIELPDGCEDEVRAILAERQREPGEVA